MKMFGLISKKKLIREAAAIYELNDTGKASGSTGEERIKDFYYRCGNANALNGLCARLGINLTEHIIQAQ